MEAAASEPVDLYKVGVCLEHLLYSVEPGASHSKDKGAAGTGDKLGFWPWPGDHEGGSRGAASRPLSPCNIHAVPLHRDVQIGDIVTVGECRPLSKTVRFNVLKVTKAAGTKKQFQKF